MAQQNQETLTFGFRSIQLLKTNTLGIGSYGSVCKAECDDLLCAAKIIHPTLYDPTAQLQIVRHREHRLPFRRFQQECEFMSALKHPNIVQYLGMHQDLETGLPVLLMELMDDSLTHFLESSQNPVPYHIQVNFCHDITMAISYLHSNEIIHRDLSSNNVLLRGNDIAKVTDFGMAKLGHANPRSTRISLTMVPGTDAYMPPEAVKNPPVYTAKIDCFAIGTLIIQILTKRFPDPADRLKSIQINHPQFPNGTVEVRVSELERRQNHISQVDPNHPLLPIALHCLKDSDVERPSAQELCHRVAALKERSQYTESMRGAREREEQIRELQQQIQQKDGIIQEKDDVNRLLQQQHAQQIQECQQLREIIQDKDCLVEERERQLQHVHQQIEKNKQVTAQLQERIQDLEHQLKTNLPGPTVELIAEPSPIESSGPVTIETPEPTPTQVEDPIPRKTCPKRVRLPVERAKPQPSFRDHSQTHHSVTSSRAETSSSFKLKWKKGKEAPCRTYRLHNAVVDGDMMYFMSGYDLSKMYAYNTKKDTWNQLPDSPTHSGSLAVVNHLITTIGRSSHNLITTNQLFSLTGKGKNSTWKEVFPPMPTKRLKSTAVCNGQALIVAGGRENDRITYIRKVEVMDVTARQWSTAANLSEPLSEASATICGDRIYILGGLSDTKPTKSVFTCSLADLLLSCQSRSLREHLDQSLSLASQTRSAETDSVVWNKVADLPVKGSTCITFHGRLLAIGGTLANDKLTSDVRIYNSASNQWETISTMTEARNWCFAAALPNNKIMVVGGLTSRAIGSKTDSVEIASVI